MTGELNGENPLNDAIGKLCHGFDANEVICALASILSMAIINGSPTLQQAGRNIDKVCKSMKRNADVNWPLVVEERRNKGAP